MVTGPWGSTCRPIEPTLGIMAILFVKKCKEADLVVRYVNWPALETRSVIVAGSWDQRCMVAIPCFQNVLLRGCLDKGLAGLAGPCNQ